MQRTVRLPFRAFRAASYVCGWRRWCPVCRHRSLRFTRYGRKHRPDARCWWCGALERHRLVWSWFVEQTDLLDGRPKSMLHVAPEKCFEPKLRRALGSGYVTADLTKNTDVQMDICSIPFPDEHFDVVYCSHVLEHVPDDRRAMHELCRVLKPTGWAVLLVPVTRERTIEDPSITDPAERERLFGQHDHVRRYGPDYADRLREAGFHVAHTAAREIHPPERLRRLGLATAETERDGIFTCTKA